jgi:hypothetical protein
LRRQDVALSGGGEFFGISRSIEVTELPFSEGLHRPKTAGQSGYVTSFNKVKQNSKED